jgi:hypothetical protein
MAIFPAEHPKAPVSSLKIITPPVLNIVYCNWHSNNFIKSYSHRLLQDITSDVHSGLKLKYVVINTEHGKSGYLEVL